MILNNTKLNELVNELSNVPALQTPAGRMAAAQTIPGGTNTLTDPSQITNDLKLRITGLYSTDPKHAKQYVTNAIVSLPSCDTRTKIEALRDELFADNNQPSPAPVLQTTHGEVPVTQSREPHLPTPHPNPGNAQFPVVALVVVAAIAIVVAAIAIVALVLHNNQSGAITQNQTVNNGNTLTTTHNQTPDVIATPQVVDASRPMDSGQSAPTSRIRNIAHPPATGTPRRNPTGPIPTIRYQPVAETQTDSGTLSPPRCPQAQGFRQEGQRCFTDAYDAANARTRESTSWTYGYSDGYGHFPYRDLLSLTRNPPNPLYYMPDSQPDTSPAVIQQADNPRLQMQLRSSPPPSRYIPNVFFVAPTAGCYRGIFEFTSQSTASVNIQIANSTQQHFGRPVTVSSAHPEHIDTGIIHLTPMTNGIRTDLIAVSLTAGTEVQASLQIEFLQCPPPEPCDHLLYSLLKPQADRSRPLASQFAQAVCGSANRDIGTRRANDPFSDQLPNDEYDTICAARTGTLETLENTDESILRARVDKIANDRSGSSLQNWNACVGHKSIGAYLRLIENTSRLFSTKSHCGGTDGWSTDY